LADQGSVQLDGTVVHGAVFASEAVLSAIRVRFDSVRRFCGEPRIGLCGGPDSFPGPTRRAWDSFDKGILGTWNCGRA
jgi:hypothetical protein